MLEVVQRVREEEKAQTHYHVKLLRIREISISLSDKIMPTQIQPMCAYYNSLPVTQVGYPGVTKREQLKLPLARRNDNSCFKNEIMGG